MLSAVRHSLQKVRAAYWVCMVLCLAFSVPAKAQATANVSATDRQHILFIYQLVRDSLLTLPVQPFTLSPAEYTEPAFEAARKQIWKGNLPQVKGWLLQVLSKEDVVNNLPLYITAQSVWVDYLLSIDSFATAYAQAQKLVILADSIRSKNAGIAYLALARAAFYQNATYASAYKNVEKVLAIAAATGNTQLEGKAQLVAGTLARRYFYATTGRSIQYYDKAIAAATIAQDTPTLIRSLILKQDDLAQAGKMGKGLPFFEEAIRLIIRFGSRKFASNVYEGLFLKLDTIGEKNKAIQMLLFALDATRRFGMVQSEMHMYMQLSDVYAGRHMYDSSLYYIDQYTHPQSLPPGGKNVQIAKADIYYTMGRYRQAAELYHSGMEAYINTYITHGQDELNRWETTLRTQEKERQLQQNAAKRRQLIWLTISIAAVLAVTLVALLWQRSLRRRLAAQNRLISRQSLKLQQSLAEKEVLLKEIHHRVKNNLQVIDSLLDMHQGGISGPQQQEEAFTKARTHVHTITMIHQNLYQQQDVSAVDMQAFANNLFAQTELLFNKYEKKVVFTSHIPNIYLDIDTAVPLGLILNELLTNAFKYVVPTVGKMELMVSITPGDGPEKYILQCYDNGPGLPGGTLPVHPKSLGMQLIKQLSRQIGGQLSYEYKEGSWFTIPFLTIKGRKEMD